MIILTRKAAIDAGSSRYFTGKPCPHGHVCERIVSSRKCVECNREYSRNRMATDDKYRIKSIERINNIRSKVLSGEVVITRNPDVVRRYKRRHYNKNPLPQVIRVMLRRCIHGKVKKDATFSMIGYTPSELMERIESMFSPGMTWDNYGDWHIDHIKPVSAFLNEGETDPSIINSLSNLQPLWSCENLKKGAKF